MNMEHIKELIKEYCYDQELDYNENYSGRGMHGIKCAGIICDNPLTIIMGLFAFILDSGYDLEGYQLQHILGEPRNDGMGTKSILYFPKLRTN